MCMFYDTRNQKDEINVQKHKQKQGRKYALKQNDTHFSVIGVKEKIFRK